MIADNASVVYLTPSIIFRSARSCRSRAVSSCCAGAAGKPGRYIIEDDYDGEFRACAIPALREKLDREAASSSTRSRSLAPGLRIGYLVLPDALMARYRERFPLYAATVELRSVYACGVHASGGFGRHISRSRKVYQARRDALMAAIDREFTDCRHEISRSDSLHLLLHMRNGMLERELVERAKAAGVRVYALSALPPVRPPRATLVLGYAGMTGEADRRGRAWREHG